MYEMPSRIETVLEMLGKIPLLGLLGKLYTFGMGLTVMYWAAEALSPMSTWKEHLGVAFLLIVGARYAAELEYDKHKEY